MTAARPPHNAPRLPWPTPSKATLSLWEARHLSYTTFSPAYIRHQRLMLWLADVPPQTRWEAFEEHCLTHRIAATTAFTYWTTWLSIQKALDLVSPHSDARVTRILRARSVTYPVDFPQPLVVEHVRTLRAMYEQSHPMLTTLIVVAWMLGQRFGDIIQLATSDVIFTEHLVTITVRRGKVMATQPPFTLFLEPDSYPATSLRQLVSAAQSIAQLYICTASNAVDERAAVALMASTMLVTIDDSLELRSIRRGGLQHMAQEGIPLSAILNFSRHTSENMLLRYLNWGAISTHRSAPMLEIAQLMRQAISQP